uniref:Putative secreted peptide n=1 Tax=Anopheles braziliensis TaxID=58242 RepID=A0A2M3ZW76_9DIPT
MMLLLLLWAGTLGGPGVFPGERLWKRFAIFMLDAIAPSSAATATKGNRRGEKRPPTNAVQCLNQTRAAGCKTERNKEQQHWKH